MQAKNIANKYKALLLLLAFTVSGCGPSKSEVELQAKISIQQQFNTDLELKDNNIKVESVSAIKEASNKYKGIAVISFKGKLHNIAVDIYADGDSLIWQAAPTAMSFVMQENLEERRKTLNSLTQSLKESSMSNSSQPNEIKWLIQIASLENVDAANELIERIKKLGYQSIKTKTEGYHRVFVGPFESRTDANLNRDKLQKEYNLNGFVIHIKTPAAERQ